MRGTSLIVFVLGFFSFFVLTPAAESVDFTTRTINDSLVENLECRNLNIDNIYRSIREDAFDVSRNMPVKNWSFKSGVATIAGCWALSRTQRMISYLARYNTPSNNQLETRVSVLLDMIRGATLVPRWNLNYENVNEEKWSAEDDDDEDAQANEINTNSIKQYCEKRLNKYKVFEVEDDNFSESKIKSFPSLWQALQIGYDQFFGGKRISRNFREEIEAQQVRSFYRLKNLKLIWKNRARSEKRNQETIKLLTKNLNGKRLTLLDLRMDRTRQHVVMAKTYRKISPALYEFKVYDSNAPHVDSSLFYNSHRQAFFSPEILTRFKDEKPYRNLGVFIVDEEDRGKFETAMLNHYRELCK